MRALERFMLLQIIDERWREHLHDMDYLREGIHLRGFAQIDPLVAYKNEGFDMFRELMNSIWEEFAPLHLQRRGRDRAEPTAEASAVERGAPNARAVQLRRRRPRAAERLRGRRQAGVAGGRRGGASRRRAARPVETRHVDEREKIGRNDPCWCGRARSSRSAMGHGEAEPSTEPTLRGRQAPRPAEAARGLPLTQLRWTERAAALEAGDAGAGLLGRPGARRQGVGRARRAPPPARDVPLARVRHRRPRGARGAGRGGRLDRRRARGAAASSSRASRSSRRQRLFSGSTTRATPS